MPWRRWGNDWGKETEKSNRKREREIKIPLLWYLCHHHRWSIRLNSICLTGHDKRVRDREREKKKGHICCSVDRCGDTEGHFPKKRTKDIWHKECDISLSPVRLWIHPPSPASSIPAFPDHLFLSKGCNFVFVYIFSICLSRKEFTLCFSLWFSLSPSLPSFIYLTFALSVDIMFVLVLYCVM